MRPPVGREVAIQAIPHVHANRRDFIRLPKKSCRLKPVGLFATKSRLKEMRGARTFSCRVGTLPMPGRFAKTGVEESLDTAR
jgi:hypothetical protein